MRAESEFEKQKFEEKKEVFEKAKAELKEKNKVQKKQLTAKVQEIIDNK